MQVLDFKITNFRSIVDTDWRKLSPDNVTVLIGQNESGKTSVLEALAKTFSSQNISDDDTRIDEPLPKVYLRVKLSKEDIESLRDFLYGEEYNDSQIESLEKYFLKNENPIELMFHWASDGKGGYKKSISISDEKAEALEEVLKKYLPKKAEEQDQSVNPDEGQEANENSESDADSKPDEGTPETEDATEEGIEVTLNTVADALNEVSPTITFFEHETGLLPSRIDISKNKQDRYVISGPGATAAKNFLIVAGLKLDTLLENDVRTRASLLSKANAQITKNFSTFWSQTIGRKDKLKLECEVQTYGTDAEEKAGERYLLFWVSDGLNKLYPKQRSQGVRWFVSFYLQLKASEMQSSKRLFLLDEPGANLHSKAQTDVIKLINDLSKDMSIVYSTHIPHMLEYDKLYRVLAVQRMGEEDDSPTEIKPAHELGTASTDTLSPVLTAMGVDLANQEVIKKKYNVLLEEMSGFYYLKAFWELTDEKQEAHFIAATGVNKLPNFANMFLGWGLEYIVVVDDDKSGRGVYNSLKKDIFSDDEELAKENMYKIKGCDGIEDVFSENDFKTHVIDDAAASIATTNSAYMKDKKLSKPVHAYTFLLKVRGGEIAFKNLDADTQRKIKDLTKEITDRLSKDQQLETASAA